MPADFDACSARRQANATLAHSAVDLCPGEVMEDNDGDRLGFIDMFGELDIRLRDRGCKGDCGIEFDRRSVLRAEALSKSLEDSFARMGLGALMASVRALRVPLMTSVASIDRSFGDNCPSHP